MSKYRTFHIVQYIVNPDNGNTIIATDKNGNVLCDKDHRPIDYGLTEEKILNALNRRTIKKYAYILHDKDIYIENRIKNGKIIHPKGTLKAAHFHVVISCSPAVSVEKIAEWFGVMPNYVQIVRGRNGFIDNVRYLTHESENEQKLGKYLYADEEIHSNFDFRSEIDSLQKNRDTYGADLSPKEEMLYNVLYFGLDPNYYYDSNSMKTKTQEQMDKINNISLFQKLKKCRAEYLSHMPMPSTRINIYICGNGGSGKGVISRAIARELYPDKNEDQAIFNIGSANSEFEEYNGQPVAIWNDRRSVDLINELDGRSNVFTLFDVHPIKQRQNVKFGSVNLVNKYNIVNSVEDYLDFLNGLSGEYRDKYGNLRKSEMSQKEQAYRRFPIIIILKDETYDLLVNESFIKSNGSYLKYKKYRDCIGSMRRVMESCGNNIDDSRKLQAKIVAPIIEQIRKISAEQEAYNQAAIESYNQELDRARQPHVMRTVIEEKKYMGETVIKAVDSEYYENQNVYHDYDVYDDGDYDDEIENDDTNNDSLESGIDDIYPNSIEYQWLKMM